MKRMISLSLVVMMLISLFVPSGAVFAQDTAKEITEKVTQGLPDVVIKGNTDKDLVKDGVLVGDKNLGRSGTIEINYKWEISKVKGNGINAGDYFLVPLPEIPTVMVNNKEVPLLKGAGFDPNVPIDITKDGEVLGNFVVDTTAGHIKATLSPLAVEKQAITDGFFKIKFILQDHAEIIVDAAAPNKKDILKFIKRIPPKEPLPGGVNRPDNDFKKGGVEVSGDDVVRWEMNINQKQMVEYMEGRPFESKENVWIEDELSGSNLTIQTSPIRIYANFFLATEEGKMGSYAYRTQPINATVAAGNLVLSTSEDNTFEEFKTRVKALPDKKPLTVYVYQRKDDSQKDGILFYVGNLNETDAKTYDEIYPGVEQSVDGDLKAFLADGRINQARYDNTRSLFGIDDDPSTKMKKVMGYKLVFDTKVAGKTTAGNVAQMVWDNGQPLSGKALAKYDGKATGGAGYVETTAVIVEKKWEGKEGGPVTVNLLQNGSTFRTVKLGVQNPSGANETSAWSFVFSELPKQDAGKTDYVYSVEEVAMENYTTTYAPANKTGQNIVITNTYSAPKTVVFKVKKEWVGPATGDSVVSLYGKDKNVALQTRTLSPNALTAIFDKVPELDDTNTKINYTLEETTVPANAEKLSINLAEDNTFVVKNRNTEKVSAMIEKKWIGQAQDQLTVYLTINGKRSTEAAHKIGLQPNAVEQYNWKATISNLPKYDENGDPIAYSFEEELPKGYSRKSLEKKDDYDVVITNLNNKEIDINVTKEWKNSSVEKVTVRLHATRTKGADAGTKEVGVAELSAANKWTHKFASNRAYDQETGEEIVYSVTEDKVPNFATEIKGNQVEGFTVVNTYLPPIPPYVPEVPAEPSEPTKPTPETPTEPTKPAPEVPTNPGTPTDVLPEDPTPQGDPNVKPTEPTKPQDPSVPETVLPENPIPQGNKELPKTDGIPAAAILLLGAGLAGLGAFFKKEK